MENKSLDGLLDVVKYKHKSGLTVYLVPILNRNSYYIEYVVKYGAGVRSFKSKNDKEYKKVIDGVAHFIEHKLFEQENGVDPFTFYSRYGTDSNASTGYKKTEYILDGALCIEDNLEFLLKYVNEPYFTYENVENEKDIIAQELKMYLDDNDSIIHNECLNIVFKNHPMKTDIGGSLESIKKITKEDLYSCYNAFYKQDNMFLVIAGNFDVDSVLRVIKNNEILNKKNDHFDIVIKDDLEIKSVYKKEKIIYLDNLFLQRLCLIFKLPFDKKGIDAYKYVTACELIMDILYGEESSFIDRILSMGYATDFYFNSIISDKFLLIEFFSEGYNVKDVINEMKKEFTRDISCDELDRLKKSMIANYVFESEKTIYVADSITYDIINYGDVIYNKIDIIRSISYSYIKEVKDSINFDNSSYVLAYPKNK